MKVVLFARVEGSTEEKALECKSSGELKILLCGQTVGGDIVPLLVDADGKIVLST